MTEKIAPRKALEIYIRLGDRRSLKKLHEALMVDGHQVALRTLENWSAKYRWPGRIAEFERKAEEADRAVHIEEIRAMRKRQVGEGQYLQQRAFQVLEKTPDDQIPPRIAVSMLQQGAKLEREARGLTSQRDMRQSAGRAERPREVDVYVRLPGPRELFMFPDPDPPDPPALPPTVEGEEDEEDMEDAQEEADEAVPEY